MKVQLWVQHKGLKVVVIFEGRDAAGKGGVIKRITESVSPRVFQGGRAAGADRTREIPDVRAALRRRIFRLQAKWSSSIAAGTTARESNG